MDKGWLERRLTEGVSFEAIGRELGADPSTVAYWARKHGLASSFAERHAARGRLERGTLVPLVAAGLTQREIAAAVNRSPSTVRHWLKQYGLATKRERAKIREGKAGDESNSGSAGITGRRPIAGAPAVATAVCAAVLRQSPTGAGA